MSKIRLRLAGLMVLLASLVLLVSVPQLAGASAKPAAEADPTYQVTLVARACDGYTSIMANRARNNIQESLQDLGPDTLYSSGQQVRPQVEDVDATTQVAGCDPLDGWKFQLGTGIGSKSDFLSQVSNPYSPPTAETTASVPELDSHGQPTGRTVAGATTITLTSAQAALAQQSSKLWIQGGVVGDPLLDNPPSPFDPPQAFGALRCAVDNLNGDNVEWIRFPSGETHVFCYYFGVSEPQKPATIRVVKKLPDSQEPVNRNFAFAGSVSYEPGPTDDPQDNPFLVPVNGRTGSVDFIRAADTADPWTLYEATDPDWALTDAKCRSRDGTSTIAPPGSVEQGPGGKFGVTLGAGDLVTCTFTNVRDTAGLTIDKVTDAGTGTFDFTGTSNKGQNVQSGSATTLEPGVPVQALAITDVSGKFTAQEDLPAGVSPDAWKISHVSCNGSDVSPTPAIGEPISRHIGPSKDVHCTFYNSPQGSITIRKTTVGGAGTFAFAITPLGEFPVDPISMAATTDMEGVPATAAATQGSNTGLPFQRYSVTELAPPTTPDGVWRVAQAHCDAADSEPTGSPDLTGASFTLTPQDPAVVCDFTDDFEPAASLQVEKTVTGDQDARTGGVLVSVQCNDATAASVIGPVGSDGPFSLDEPLPFTDFLWDNQGNPTLSCNITEPETGVADDATVTTHWTVVTDGIAGPTTTGDESVVVDPQPGQHITVQVENRYKSPPSPTPTPTITESGSSGPATPTGGTSQTPDPSGNPLPGTGTPTWMLVALMSALAMLVVGTALVLGSFVSRRTPRH